MKFALLMCLAFSVIGCSSLYASENADSTRIEISQGKYSNYYHIRYVLRPDNFELTRNHKRFVRKNGQFEIYLDKNSFPIPAPKCKGRIILRMPASLKGDRHYQANVRDKLSLYDEIRQVHDRKRHPLAVVIELNPYVKVISKKPLALELEECNVFFRTRHGAYIDTLK